MAGNNDSKVYVGNLPADIRARDLEDIFYKYGKIVDVDLHDRRGPPFAFVEFEDARFDVFVFSPFKTFVTPLHVGMRKMLLEAEMATCLTATAFESSSLAPLLAAAAAAAAAVAAAAAAAPTGGLREVSALATDREATSCSCPASHPLGPGR